MPDNVILPLIGPGSQLDANVEAIDQGAGIVRQVVVLGSVGRSGSETQLTAGQKTSATSLPVVVASDQSAVAVAATAGLAYGTSTPIACTTTALASDANLLAGRQSDVVSNAASPVEAAFLGGTIATTGIPTPDTRIEVWLFGSWDGGTTFTAGAAGTGDATFTPATYGVKELMVQAIVVRQTDNVARSYALGPLNVADFFAGYLPDHWGFYVVHNTGATLGATALSYRTVSRKLA